MHIYIPRFPPLLPKEKKVEGPLPPPLALDKFKYNLFSWS